MPLPAVKTSFWLDPVRLSSPAVPLMRTRLVGSQPEKVHPEASNEDPFTVTSWARPLVLTNSGVVEI